MNMKKAGAMPKDSNEKSSWRRALSHLRGLHVPIGLHISALVVQSATWGYRLRECRGRETCSFPWLEDWHLIIAGGEFVLILYFWIGFAGLNAMLNRSRAPFRRIHCLILAMGILTLVAFAISAAIALALPVLEPMPNRLVIY